MDDPELEELREARRRRGGCLAFLAAFGTYGLVLAVLIALNVGVIVLLVVPAICALGAANLVIRIQNRLRDRRNS